MNIEEFREYCLSLKGVYEKALRWVLNHKRITLGSTIALFIVALGCFFVRTLLLTAFQRRFIYHQYIFAAGYLSGRE